MLALAGCAIAPPPPASHEAAPPPAPAPADENQAIGQFEARQRVRALLLEDEGQWAEAAWTWEVLTVLRPAHRPYRERAAALQRRIAAAVAQQLGLAEAARRRGAPELAATHYLRVLALQPEHAQAADALRTIERDRNARLYLGKPSRLTILRRDGLVPVPPGRGAAIAPPATGRSGAP